MGELPISFVSIYHSYSLSSSPFRMSMLAVIIVICLAIIFFFSDHNKNKTPVSTDSTTRLKRKDNYLRECHILTQMTQQKAEHHTANTKPKLSIHIHTQQDISHIQTILTTLTEKFNLYLISNLNEPQTEIRTKMQQLIKPSRLFKCKTLEGEIAIIRQLNPKIHIETDSKIINALKPYLNLIVTSVASFPTEGSPPNVYHVQSDSQLFDAISSIKV